MSAFAAAASLIERSNPLPLLNRDCVPLSGLRIGDDKSMTGGADTGLRLSHQTAEEPGLATELE